MEEISERVIKAADGIPESRLKMIIKMSDGNWPLTSIKDMYRDLDPERIEHIVRMRRGDLIDDAP